MGGSLKNQAGSKPKPMASVPSSSVPILKVVKRNFMPSVTFSGLGSVFTTLPRTLVPPQSMIPATKGTGTPGAAKATMVNDFKIPSVEIATFLKSF